MPFYIKTSNSGWSKGTGFFVKTSPTTWKPVLKAFVKNVTGGWSQFWPKIGPSLTTPLGITTNQTQYPSSGNAYPKLTGYNYHWNYNGSLTLNYSFQKSSTANGSYSNVTGSGGTGPISNPSLATFTNSPSDYTVQYPGDFVANPTYFTFTITATDSNGVTTETSNVQNNGNGYVAIYAPTTTISGNYWQSGPYFSNSSTNYYIGTVSNASYTRTYITRSDGTVMLNDTTFNSKVKTSLGQTPTDNQGSVYQIIFDSTDVGKTYSAYTIAYDLSNNGTSSGIATMSTSVLVALTISTQPTTTLTGQDVAPGNGLQGNTGTFSTTPDGVFWTWQISTDNVKWYTMYSDTSFTPVSSGTDTIQGQNHTLTIPYSVNYYTTSWQTVSPIGKYIRFYSNAYIGSTYANQPSNSGLGPILDPTPQPIVSPSISASTVGKTIYGNMGSWSFHPSNYSYYWKWMNGSTLTPLTNGVGTASVTNKIISGTTGTLTTLYPGGYRVGGSLTVSSVDGLFNGTQTITAIFQNIISFNLTVPAYSLTTAYTANTSYVLYQGIIYQSVINIPTAAAYAGNSYSAGSSVTYNGYRYYALTSVPAYSSVYPASLDTSMYPSGNSSSTSYWKFVSPTDTYFFTSLDGTNTSSSGAVAGLSYNEGFQQTSPGIYPLFLPSTDNNTGISLVGKTLYFIVQATNYYTISSYSATKTIYGLASATLGSVTNGDTVASVPYTLTNGGELDLSISPTSKNIVFTTPVYGTSGTISITGLTDGTTYTLSAIPYNPDFYAGTTQTATLLPALPLRTVTFYGNTNTGGSTTSQTTNSPSPLRLNGFTKTGYSFNGWNTSADGTGTSYSDGATYNFLTDLSLYAQWSIIHVYPSITMSNNTGITSSSATINWTSTNQSYAYVNSTYAGNVTSYTFTGLSASTNYSGTVTVYSSSGDSASANYSFTTSAALTSPIISGSSISPSSGTAGSTTFIAIVGTVTGNPTPSISYQWQYFSSTSYTYVNVSGAISSTYTPPSNFNTLYPNLGFYCAITATNSQGSAIDRPSATLSNPAASAPTVVNVSGDNLLTKGGTFIWSANGSPAPTYRIVIGYNATNSAGPFSTKYDSGIGSILTSIRPGYDISGYTFVAGYYRCTVIATNSAGSANGSVVTYMN